MNLRFDLSSVTFSDLRFRFSPSTLKLRFKNRPMEELLAHNGLGCSTLYRMHDAEICEIVAAWFIAHRAAGGSFSKAESKAIRDMLMLAEFDRPASVQRDHEAALAYLARTEEARRLRSQRFRIAISAWRSALKEDMRDWKLRLQHARETTRARHRLVRSEHAPYMQTRRLGRGPLPWLLAAYARPQIRQVQRLH